VTYTPEFIEIVAAAVRVKIGAGVIDLGLISPLAIANALLPENVAGVKNVLVSIPLLTCACVEDLIVGCGNILIYAFSTVQSNLAIRAIEPVESEAAWINITSIPSLALKHIGFVSVLAIILPSLTRPIGTYMVEENVELSSVRVPAVKPVLLGVPGTHATRAANPVIAAAVDDLGAPKYADTSVPPAAIAVYAVTFRIATVTNCPAAKAVEITG
jgi:hypothetical protein